MTNEYFMQRCLDLAYNGLGRVAPNPMVGAVLVHDGKIIGEGFHQQYGHPHAEVNAINDAEKKHKIIPENTTLYVNLEPCNHHGKTPPCSELIIKKGIKKVVIGAKDPNDKVEGKGIEVLKYSGCEVNSGVLEIECKELNKAFYTFYEKHRPCIILKWAQSFDGYLSSGNYQREWISNEYSRKLSHKWRSEIQGIMVGKNTALHDDPTLNVRVGISNIDINHPIRITFDKDLTLPKHLKLFDQTLPTIIFTERNSSSLKNLEFIKINFSKDVIKQILNELQNRNVNSLLVEGGTMLLDSFIQEDLWDEARIFHSENCLNSGIKAPVVNRTLIQEDKIETDLLKVYKNFNQ
jgi:diaminohydroxyphosphoribosylaminopyrimidine deaminase/5-amino-6-(5-phosphoribosylamino)uracil reductase